jgi:hypothetical protein
MLAALAVALLAGAASVAVALTGGDRRATAPVSPSAVPAAAGARFTHPDDVATFVAAATAEIPAVTSYDYRRLDDALAAGLSVTTGSFRGAFRNTITGLTATAKARRVVRDFQVLDAGMGALTADRREGKVLVFGRETVTDRDTPAGGTALVTLCLTLRRAGDRYLIKDLQSDANAGLPPGSRDLSTAARSAQAEVTALLTYRRATFAADRQRALAGAIDPARAEIDRTAQAARRVMAKGRYDLTGTVTALAAKSATGSVVTLLVAGKSTRTPESGSPVTSAVRYEVTMSQGGGRWLATQITPLTTG